MKWITIGLLTMAFGMAIAGVLCNAETKQIENEQQNVPVENECLKFIGDLRINGTQGKIVLENESDEALGKIEVARDAGFVGGTAPTGLNSSKHLVMFGYMPGKNLYIVSAPYSEESRVYTIWHNGQHRAMDLSKCPRDHL
ncbi:hypothetical protein HQ571_02205 [Candidatus Kuenenbacteria bacterium]|nr:hypothetical protein [Candidatus Kuenenbacteria bacterium]